VYYMLWQTQFFEIQSHTQTLTHQRRQNGECH
jgi:hypothetical protein